MLEFLSVVGILAVLYMAFIYAKFVGFKKRLMAEFARRGVPLSEAEDIYFRTAGIINTMNFDGRSLNEIVDEVLARYPELFH